MGTRWATVIAISAIFAGCAQAPAAPAGSSDSGPVFTGPAASAMPDEGSGSITGTVVDDEKQPIGLATVVLLEVKAEQRTDNVGRYTFNGLAAAFYTVTISALGYEAYARRVEVRPGEITYVNATLRPIAIAAAAYFRAIPKVAHITAEQGFVAQEMEYQNVYNLSTVRNMMCSNCRYWLYIERSPVQVLSEVRWASSPINTEAELRYMWNRSTTDTLSLGNYQWDRMSSGDKMNWTAANIKSLHEKKVTKLELTVTSSQLGVSYDHKIETWTTFAYGDMLAEKYTAFAS